jgi:hypothetical protein
MHDELLLDTGSMLGTIEEATPESLSVMEALKALGVLI